MRSLAVALALGFALILQVPQSAARAADVTVGATTVENGHPKSVTFKVSAQAPLDITDVSLQYKLTGSNSSAFSKPDDFTPGKTQNIVVKVETDPNGKWIPVGSEFTFHWEFTLSDGSTFSSKDEVYVYLPTNHQWQTLKSSTITVFYFGERSALVNQFVSAADEVLSRIGKDLLNTQLPSVPVRVVLLANEQETAINEPSKGTTFDQQRSVVVCGFRPSGTSDLVIGTITCGGSDPVDTFRHEFAHLLTKAAGESSLVKVPSWLDEGVAVTAQKSATEYTSAFNASIRAKKDILPFDRMNNYPSDPNQTILWYGQSFTMTQFLIQKYGPQKMAQYFAAMKKGTRSDLAFQQVYGIDQKGFEDGFKAAVGIGTAQPTATPRQQQQQRTTPAATAASQPKAKASTSSGSDFDRTSLVIIGGSFVLALLAVMSFLAAMMMQNSRTQRVRAAAGAAPTATGGGVQPSSPDRRSTDEPSRSEDGDG